MPLSDPLAITRGFALTDVGLAAAGLDRAARLPLWQASLTAMAAHEADLGIGGWLLPGVVVEVETLREGPVLAQMGWPSLAAGPSMMRLPIRRFGTLSWDLDGGSWAPLWWLRIRRRASVVEWDVREDERHVAEEIAAGFDLVWMNHLWEHLHWDQAIPGWTDRVFAANHAALKRGLLAAFEVAERGDPIVHLPVLAGGSKLEKATSKTLRQPKTVLFSPSEAGFRAFLENVRIQGVPRHQAMSMAWTWWGRALDEERP